MYFSSFPLHISSPPAVVRKYHTRDSKPPNYQLIIILEDILGAEHQNICRIMLF
jgi:hypothetical protein